LQHPIRTDPTGHRGWNGAMNESTRPLLILIAGPYRSGTGGDPGLIEANLRRLEQPSWELHRRGHVPMIGEWVGLPILRVAGDSASDGDVLYEVASRLLQHCDGVLRLPGESSGADTDVRIATERGIPVWYSIDDVPSR
jgi:hypothetical protein